MTPELEEVRFSVDGRQAAFVRKWFVIVLCVVIVRCCVLQAEKAEGYIDLANFMIDRAIECKKKQ